MKGLFDKYKDKPPLNKNNPPVAGAIYWCRSLFQRIKHTIVRFHIMPFLIQSEEGIEVGTVFSKAPSIVL